MTPLPNTFRRSDTVPSPQIQYNHERHPRPTESNVGNVVSDPNVYKIELEKCVGSGLPRGVTKKDFRTNWEPPDRRRGKNFRS